MLKDSLIDPSTHTYKLFIGGDWVTTSTVNTILDPFTSDVVSTVYTAGKEEMLLAIDSASNSYSKIAHLTSKEKGKIFEKTAMILEKYIDEIASLIVLESGKTITDSIHEVTSGIERIRYGVSEAETISSDVIHKKAIGQTKKTGMIIRQPLGVILAITPFNYPFFAPLSKIVPAIASGNSVILKPASDDPTVTLLIARAFEEAGLPKGVLHVVIGSGKDVGEIIVPHPSINMISFTGSSTIGMEVAKKAVLAKLHMELGGKCPAIVLFDAHIDLASKECIKGGFKYSGQRCDAISRIIIEQSISKEFINALVNEGKKWKTGDPKDMQTMMGPLINEKAIIKVEELVVDAVSKGAKVLLGGKREDNTLFFEPTILTHVTGEMRIAWEETFGPVLPVICVKDYDEAISFSNKSEYALDSSIFTTSVERALDAGVRLESGTVQINAAPSHGIGDFPFGGDESSGLGRQGIIVSAQEMTKLHTIIFNE
jgi:glyceraldehyde-3-phosphate dehydrogenase (NADP+)